MKKLKISQLAPGIRYLQTLALNRRPKETNISFSGVSRHGPFRLVAKSVNVPFIRDC